MKRNQKPATKAGFFNKKGKEPDDIINHLFEDSVGYLSGESISPPIFQTSNFGFSSFAEFKKALKNEKKYYLYTRGNNPTVELLRKKLAALEKAEDALVVSSGSAAVALAVLSQVKQGDHIICVEKPYSWTYTLLHNFLRKYGVEVTFVNGTQLKNFEKALRKNTKLVYLETPNSITFELQDLPAIAQWAKHHQLVTICDNSYASPLGQQPIAMGIDIVVHSGTKYINGHSDVVCGVICSSRTIIDKIFRHEMMTLGAIISPLEAWLILRGLRTLPLRMAHSTKTCQEIVSFLEQHPKIEKVIYPFSPSHPQYNLAMKQMKPLGSLFSILLKVHSIKQIERFSNTLSYFKRAVSWGGYESLHFPYAVTINKKEETDKIPWNLVRIYVGLESAKTLLQDLEKGLTAI